MHRDLHEEAEGPQQALQIHGYVPRTHAPRHLACYASEASSPSPAVVHGIHGAVLRSDGGADAEKWGGTAHGDVVLLGQHDGRCASDLRAYSLPWRMHRSTAAPPLLLPRPACTALLLLRARHRSGAALLCTRAPGALSRRVDARRERHLALGEQEHVLHSHRVRTEHLSARGGTCSAVGGVSSAHSDAPTRSCAAENACIERGCGTRVSGRKCIAR